MAREKKALTAGQKRARLKQLAVLVRRHLYDMLKIADELLFNKEYVDQFGGESQLMDDLSANEFSHFGGSPSLSEMLRAYRASPSKLTWDAYGHNIWAMIDLASPKKDAGETVKTNWKALAKELQLQVEVLKKELDKAHSDLDEFRALNADLRATNTGLQKEVGVFEGRIIELEKRTRAA